MKRIVVATDLSSRSDRALQRACILARRTGAEIDLVHVLDDEQPPRLLRIVRREAQDLLAEVAGFAARRDGVVCRPHVLEGKACERIAAAATDLQADLLVLGPFRRHLLRDTFVGTTAERATRQSRIPVLIANTAPAGPYARALVATDFSETALHAARKAHELGLGDPAGSVLVHAFDAPAQGPVSRAALPVDLREGHMAEEEAARRKLDDFVLRLGHPAPDRLVAWWEISPAETILRAARDCRAGLVVIGTRGLGAVSGLLLGSVAAEILRTAEVDVLAVPSPP